MASLQQAPTQAKHNMFLFLLKHRCKSASPLTPNPKFWASQLAAVSANMAYGVLSAIGRTEASPIVLLKVGVMKKWACHRQDIGRMVRVARKSPHRKQKVLRLKSRTRLEGVSATPDLGRIGSNAASHPSRTGSVWKPHFRSSRNHRPS